MAHLNQMELQDLRHLIGVHETSFKKLDEYTQRATDPEIKQMFQQSAQSAQQTKQKLMQFLQ